MKKFFNYVLYIWLSLMIVFPTLCSAQMATAKLNDESVIKSETSQVTEKSFPFARRLIIREAEKYLGTPYLWGGDTPEGFDCSGYVQYVYRNVNVVLPRTTQEQCLVGVPIPFDQVKPGDLYFWATATDVYHVAIATSNGGYIHAPQPGDCVRHGSIHMFRPTFAIRLYLEKETR